MKRSDTLLKIVSALVFFAMAAYLVVYIARRFVDPVQTALTVMATMSDSAPMSGLVIRDEQILPGGDDYIDVIVDDGEKVSAGQTIAVVYSSEDALARAVSMEDLQREIENVTAALDRSGGAYTMGNRDQSIFGALTDLSESIRSDNYAGIDTRQSTLASLMFRKEVSDATEDYLQQLEASYRELLVSAAGDTRDITTNISGTFSDVVDGFEGVDPEFIRGLSPSDLREVIARDRDVDPDALGKIITSFDWYYVAILGREDASRLVAGKNVQLSFGRYYNGNLNAEVAYLGQAEKNEQVVLFRIDKAFRDMLAVRAVSAELIYSQYQGLRVPLKGLYRYYAGYMTDEDGQRLQEGQSVALTLGDRTYDAFVSDLGSPRRYGDLPYGVEPDSEADDRPTRRLVVFCWPWTDEPAPDFSSGSGAVLPAGSRTPLNVLNYYDYDPDTDRLCVFTMTGLQAERKKVDLVFAGEEYCLLSSEGNDALREGNEVIVQAANLHNGKVFR